MSVELTSCNYSEPTRTRAHGDFFMLESEYKPWKFFKNILEDSLRAHIDVRVNYEFFLQFKPRFIWNRETLKLERCVKVGDIGDYIKKRLLELKD